MKKIAVFMVAVCMAGIAMGAIDYEARKAIADIQKGEQNQNAIEKLFVVGSADVDSLIIGSATVVGPIIDTADTTDTSAYAPEAVGQFLIGSAGAGTSKVWCATGSTTNDWTLLN